MCWLKREIILCLTSIAVLWGCHARIVSTPVPSSGGPVENAYIDLQPGWRVRVVVPLLKSGRYTLDTTPQQGSGTTITLSVGADFLGYETDYYRLTPRTHGGVHITFALAEATKDGQTIRQSAPVVNLFESLRGSRYLRLLYLRRASEADHNMAALGADRKDPLEALTRRVQSDPAACVSDTPPDVCLWMPVGIAVRPEIWNVVDGTKEWTPAR